MRQLTFPTIEAPPVCAALGVPFARILSTTFPSRLLVLSGKGHVPIVSHKYDPPRGSEFQKTRSEDAERKRGAKTILHAGDPEDALVYFHRVVNVDAINGRQGIVNVIRAATRASSSVLGVSTARKWTRFRLCQADGARLGFLGLLREIHFTRDIFLLSFSYESSLAAKIALATVAIIAQDSSTALLLAQERRFCSQSLSRM